MRKINLFKYILTFACTGLLVTSCFSDLDTYPLSNELLLGEEVYSTAAGYRGALAKCYATLSLTGQRGGDAGNGDVPGIDEGYSGWLRGLFYPQVASTDEMAVYAGSSRGSYFIQYLNWTPSTELAGYPYYRSIMTIGYCNEFLRQCTESNLKERGVWEALKDEYPYFRAEARMIRAYAYNILCDLYGSVPFIDDAMPLGTVPHQKSRLEIYNYIVSECEQLANDLKAPGQNEYGRVDQATAWFMLARVCLNAEAWVGVTAYDKAYSYAKKIITDGTYPLASDYRHIFLADNRTCREIIWPAVSDADNAQNSAGTNFFVKAFLDNSSMKPYFNTGMSGSNTWNNAVVKTTFVNKFTPADQLFDPNDPWGDQKMDKRAQFFTLAPYQKNTWQANQRFATNANSIRDGYAYIKWRNVTKDRQELKPGGTQYSSVCFPVFRTADAYLMAAEAILRGGGGSRAEALSYINEIRDRAYMFGQYARTGINSVDGRITDAQMTLDFILDERSRELASELIRRTDLIRFGKYTKGYNWDWKGSDNGAAGTYMGQDVNDRYKLLPIPQNEFTVNPYITQNPDYAGL
ncbi:RagB/SusD family nutrient uptake outer membrane protein [Viscerimonas tarda]